MKKLGTFMGVDMLLDTDDEQIFQFANNHFDDMQKKLEELSELKMKAEMAIWKRPTFFEQLKRTLFN